MTTPSPYDVAKAVSDNLGNVWERREDISNMGKIIEQAKQSQQRGNEQYGQNAMQQILAQISPTRQPQAMALVQNMQDQHQQQQGGVALAQILEKPELAEQFSKLPHALQKELAHGFLEQKKQLMIQAAKAPEQPKLSAPTLQYLKDKNKEFSAADSVKDVGDRMMQLVDSISAAKGTLQGKAPAMFKSPEVAEFESLTFDLLPHYKAMFPRGITNEEFKKITKGALPQLGLSPEANKARIKKFMAKANKALSQKSSLETVQEKLGFIPENISALISKDGKKPGFASLPDPTTTPIGKKIRDTETDEILVNDGNNWVKETATQGQ